MIELDSWLTHSLETRKFNAPMNEFQKRLQSLRNMNPIFELDRESRKYLYVCYNATDFERFMRDSGSGTVLIYLKFKTMRNMSERMDRYSVELDKLNVSPSQKLNAINLLKVFMALPHFRDELHESNRDKIYLTQSVNLLLDRCENPIYDLSQNPDSGNNSEDWNSFEKIHGYLSGMIGIRMGYGNTRIVKFTESMWVTNFSFYLTIPSDTSTL